MIPNFSPFGNQFFNLQICNSVIDQALRTDAQLQPVNNLRSETIATTWGIDAGMLACFTATSFAMPIDLQTQGEIGGKPLRLSQKMAQGCKLNPKEIVGDLARGRSQVAARDEVPMTVGRSA
jgi:hypothetical protein